MSAEETIASLIKAHPVLLFMKGTRQAPQCGFSARTVAILDDYLHEYETVNVLEDTSLRDGIKSFSNWPTIPQLYVHGEFVGGCDILTEMNQQGELVSVLGTDLIEVPEPVLEISPRALDALREFWDGEGNPVIRFEVSSRFEYGLEFGDVQPGDFVIPLEGCTFLVDRATARRCDGTTIGYIEESNRTGFHIENPHEPPRVRSVSAAALAGWLEQGKPLELFDVRPPEEREVASLKRARPWNEQANAYVESLDPDTVLVFHCHHGGRSMAAAQHWVNRGFRQVYNLEGGIEAWSLNVDPDIPRY